MEGFGINTNILETNIINLTVVIGVLFILGKEILSTNLNTRLTKITQSINDVETRYLKAQEKFAEAKKTFENAGLKVQEINKQSIQTALQTRPFALERAENEIKRLKLANNSRLAVEKEDTLRKIRKELIELAFKKASATILDKRSGAAVQIKYTETILRTQSFYKNETFYFK